MNSNRFKLKPLIFLMALAFNAQAQSNTETSIEITADKVPEEMKVAPGQAKLESRMAQSYVSKDFLDNFSAPTVSYVEAAAFSPSVFGMSTNGPGLNDNKLTLRGFNNGQFTMSFDGIPINDTNGVSYHSTVFAVGPFLGGMGIDRSPGLASTFGPANYGGSFNLYSKETSTEKGGTLFGSVGSFGTFLYGADVQTGAIGSEGKTQIAMGVHEMKSDGYQTNNNVRRDGGYLKIDSEITKDLSVTLFGSAISYFTNGPDGAKVYAQDTNPNLAGINPLYKGQNYFASNDPSRLDSNTYPILPNGGATTEIRTYMNYLGIKANLGDSWKLDNKLYNMSYNNHDIFANVSSPNQGLTATSSVPLNAMATDKHNTYQKFGDILRVTNDNSLGQFRTGMWYELAVSSRFQTYFNPFNGQSLAMGAGLTNVKFAENYTTTSMQPFAEFEFKVNDKLKVTPGFKYSIYNMSLSQNPDLGSSALPSLGGGNTAFTKPGGFVGNQANPVLNNATYRSPDPFLDIHYMIKPNWSAYAQFATGNVIPSTKVFDTANAAAPSLLPPPIQTKSYQIGTVYKEKNFSIDADVYMTKADNSVTLNSSDPSNPFYYSNGATTYTGLEIQSTYAFGNGFSIYGNASKMNAIIDSVGLSAALVPTDMETLGLYYRKSDWTVGGTVKRVGPQWLDNGSTNQWGQIPQIYLTGLYANYEFKNLGSFAKSARVQFGIDNVFNKIYLTSYSPAGVNSDPNNPGLNKDGVTLNKDTVTYSAGRFTSLSFFLNF